MILTYNLIALNNLCIVQKKYISDKIDKIRKTSGGNEIPYQTILFVFFCNITTIMCHRDKNSCIETTFAIE